MAGRPKNLNNLYKRTSNVQFSEGQKSKGILDDYAERKNIDTYSGTVQKIPSQDKDIVNKEYADSMSGAVPEGTDVKSTGETGAVKYLRENGDGTSSWQAVVVGGIDWTDATADWKNDGTFYLECADDVSNAFKIDNNGYNYMSMDTTTGSENISFGNSGALLKIEPTLVSTGVNLDVTGNITVSGTVDGIDIAATSHTHANKTTLDKFGENTSGLPTYNGNKIDTTIAQRDVYDGLDSTDNTISLSAKQGKVLKDVQDTQQAAINLNTAKTGITTTQASAITANTAKVTYSGVASDHGTATTDQIVNICYGTSDTAPTASTTTEGALYVQYEA